MLQAGTKLGPYEITAPLGAGGMGEVYQARDTRLDRTVAIKILPSELAESRERRERFEREARAVSGLDHPHICRLYDIGSDDGIDFIVMEHLEGETLAERLKKGPLRLDDALRYGRQIAGALDQAHRRGVVHRDLKPGNVMLTKAGAVLLDFGLAKRTGLADDASGGSDSAQPTQAKDLTDEGTVLGTFQYMAPEQLEGGEVDARTDIFAFGAVLYEMLTGNKAFTGKSQASLIGAILKDDPPAIASLQPTSPPQLDRVLTKCLAKNPDQRWRSAHDVAELLAWAGGVATSTASPKARSTPWIAAAIAGWVIALGVWMGGGAAPDATRSSVRFSVDTSRTPRVRLTQQAPALAVSPGGQTLVFVTFSQSDITPSPLYARDLASLELRALAGTEGALSPTFSPDGEWIAFHSSPDRKLKRIRLDGGAPQTIAELGSIAVRGISWGESGFIYFNQQPSGIFRVAADGGVPELLIAPDPEKDVKTHRLPSLLPGEEHLLFVTGFASMDSYDEAAISVLTIGTGDVKVLIEGGSNPRYVPTGHILYGRDGSVMAARFDLDRLEIVGQPTAVLSGVVTSHAWGVGQFAVSEAGTLAYLPGGPSSYFPKITWIDRTGASEPFAIASRDLRDVRLSPDGSKVAFRESKGNDDVWSYDVARGTLTRVTSRWDNSGVAWTPDGRSVLYTAVNPGAGIVRKAADGSGSEEILLRVTTTGFPTLGNVAPDGQQLVYELEGDIWSLPLTVDADPTVLIGGPFNESRPHFSPDGRSIAYSSDESGRWEIYVQSYPGSGNRTLISTGGGQHPRWRGDGRELYFYGEDAIQAVAIRTEPRFDADRPEILVERPNVLDYDVTPDGRRFLVIETNASATPSEIHVALNWLDELNRLVASAP